MFVGGKGEKSKRKVCQSYSFEWYVSSIVLINDILMNIPSLPCFRGDMQYLWRLTGKTVTVECESSGTFQN